jgi:hypothetical protein
MAGYERGCDARLITQLARNSKQYEQTLGTELEASSEGKPSVFKVTRFNIPHVLLSL